MKHLKKVSAMIMALILTLAMTCTAFASSITITDAKGTAANGFAAYQIFTGDLDSTGKVLSNLVWGSNVTVDANGKVTFGEGDDAVSYTAAEAAAALTAGTLTADDLAAIVTGTPAKAAATTDDGNAVIENLQDGYYLVVTDGEIKDGEAATKYILQVIGNVEVVAKTDAPKVEKKIKDADEPDSAYRDANNVAIGDDVDYRITSNVPDMSNYEKYYYIVNDTMSAGLTYNNDMVVKVGEKTLVEGTDYDLTITEYSKTEGTSFEIVFKNFIQYKGQAGAAIVVTYSAKLNDNAKINETGNPNKVDLTYSNNPNKKGDGEDKPNDDEKDDVTGKTPEDWVITYTTKASILKKADDGKELANAQFTLTGYKKNAKTTYRETFVEDENGEYYSLKDGTYTVKKPTPLTADKYASTETTYSKTVVRDDQVEIEKVNREMTTDENGYADLGSLAAGEYTITELIAPDGYNLLESPITITVTCDSNDKEIVDGTETAVWHVYQDGEAINATGSFDEYIVEIINYAGATLPTTGGMGTTLFYVIGGILVALSGVLLITKRRMAR